MVSRERPDPRPGSVRTAVVWDALGPVLSGEPCDVVDIGGGTGGFAVRVAQAGHRVAVVDPSPDALAALSRRAREIGVEVAGHQGDVSGLLDVVGPESADLVLCHGLLEVVDAAAALATIRKVLRPGGTVSILVAQRHAAVVARAMAGHLSQALALLEGDEQSERGARAGRPPRRFTAAEISDLVEQAGFAVSAVHAVRVFTDLVPGSLLDQEAGAASALAELERAVAERPEYLPLATQIHLLAT
ncbi:methyltransferase domain-containing protein [Nocardioides humilatus]|uniref:Methyltransferase domain-containing protein n=1 Tax=Nocardioides humilatus TaxID=2607660 RepID=A0A5B1LDX4_9ACTN|nr:methyltransferase domain-containing protein [Nocardioides humilatus]KAA1417929.1 methyltransferase domain-containing protein [Nocardioides humilatus]